MSYIPNLPVETPIDEDREWSPAYWNFWQTLLQSLQKAISNEGFQIPGQPQNKIAELEASDSIPAGTLIFDTQAVNGGSTANPNGQLFIKLQDGVFHAIPNL